MSSILSSGQFLATYSFAAVSPSTGTNDPDNPPIVTGLTMQKFKANGVSTNPTASGRFVFSAWPLGGIDAVDDYTLYNGAFSGLHYYEVKLNVLPSFTLNLTSFAFSVRRSGTGVRNYSVRSSLDNFSTDLAASTGTNTRLSVLPTNIFFWKYDSVSTSSDQRGSNIIVANNFSGITDSVVFRFYAWNAEASGGSFSLDNVTFGGIVLDTNKVIDPLGLADSFADALVSENQAFYNPMKKQIQISLSEFTQKVEIFNSAGRCIKVISSFPYQTLFFIPECPDVYTIRWTDENATGTIKVPTF